MSDHVAGVAADGLLGEEAAWRSSLMGRFLVTPVGPSGLGPEASGGGSGVWNGRDRSERLATLLRDYIANGDPAGADVPLEVQEWIRATVNRTADESWGPADRGAE